MWSQSAPMNKAHLGFIRSLSLSVRYTVPQAWQPYLTYNSLNTDCDHCLPPPHRVAPSMLHLWGQVLQHLFPTPSLEMGLRSSLCLLVLSTHPQLLCLGSWKGPGTPDVTTDNFLLCQIGFWHYALLPRALPRSSCSLIFSPVVWHPQWGVGKNASPSTPVSLLGSTESS